MKRPTFLQVIVAVILTWWFGLFIGFDTVTRVGLALGTQILFYVFQDLINDFITAFKRVP